MYNLFFQPYGLSSLRFFYLKSPETLHIMPRLDTQNCLSVGAKGPLLFFPCFLLVVVRLDTLSQAHTLLSVTLWPCPRGDCDSSSHAA